MASASTTASAPRAATPSGSRFSKSRPGGAPWRCSPTGRPACVREATKATTTFGYGPRFQHSTGQEHSGGAPNGRFLQLTDTPSATVTIPGEDYDFGTLIDAQSIGDHQSLLHHDRMVLRLSVDSLDELL